MGTELKGGVLFRKREHPLWNPQRKARAAVSGLKECNASGVEVSAQVCCYTTWVTSIFAAALESYRKSQQSPPTTNFYKLATACRGGIASLAAGRTIRNVRIFDRRRSVRTLTQYAERQRIVGAATNRLSHAQWRRAKQCRHAGTFIAQRVQPFKLYACNVGGRGGLPSSFSGGYKGGILFEKRIPPLTGSSVQRCIIIPRSARRTHPLLGKQKGGSFDVFHRT